MTGVQTCALPILSGIVFLNLREGEGSLALQRAASIMTQNISQAKINSLGNKYHNGTTSSGGFGIYLKQNSSDIVIFADCDADDVFDSNGGSSACDKATVGMSYPEEFLRTSLSEQIVVSTLTPCVGTPCTLTMTFSPPDPTTVFVPGFVGNEAQIVLRDQKDRTIDIFINRLGVTRIQQ